MKTLSKIAVLMLIALFATSGAFAQKNQVKTQIEGNLGLFLPLGTFGDVSKMGFGIIGTGHFRMEKDFWLTGSIGYVSFSGKDVGAYGFSYSYPTVSVIPILAGCRYDFIQKGEKWFPYIGAELGFMITSVGSTDYDGVSASSTDLGLTLKGGFRYNLSPGWDFDGQLKFYNNFGNGASANFFGIQAGVCYSLAN